MEINGIAIVKFGDNYSENHYFCSICSDTTSNIVHVDEEIKGIAV